jgi:CRISPR-associated endoribonuclease Cas6
MISQRGELFSFLLRLSPLVPEQTVSITANQVQAAFLDMVRQVDPALFDWLRVSDQPAPSTVALLLDRDQLAAIPFEDACLHRHLLPIRSGRPYWLSITILDAALFCSFTQFLIAVKRTLIIQMGEVRFKVGWPSTTSEPGTVAQSLIAYSSFADLCVLRPAQKHYRFDFISPTILSRGLKPWGKALQTFPEPHDVFECLARQWELFAPAHLRMKMHDLSVRTFSLWCEQNLAVAHYSPATGYFRSHRFGQPGFQGMVVYEVRGMLTAPDARWLSPLARFATFSGVGCNTVIGMGRTRCTNLVEASLPIIQEEMQ